MMKPNNPSNREDLLHLIRQSLAIEDTFGNAVLEIMRRMSTDNRNDPDAESTTQPVPVYEVAAFVDGTLDDPQKTAAITKAAAYDPGLMMEIIAAIRSREEKPAQRLSSDLRSRLLALQPPFHADTASTQAEFPSTPAIVPPPLSANLLTSPLATPPATTEASNKPPSASTPPWWAPLAGLATAAAVVAAVGWWFRSGLPVQTAPIASDPVAIESPEMNPEGNVNPDTKAPSSRDARPPMLARDSGSGLASPPDIASENPNLSRPANIRQSPKAKVPADDLQENGNVPMSVVQSPAEVPEADSMTSPYERTPANDFAPSGVLAVRWEQIDGLLLRSIAERNSIDSLSDDSVPKAVTVGAEFDLISDSATSILRLQTLPLCRAAANLGGGGQLVLAADTQIELTHSGEISLQHGSIALLGLGKDMSVRLGSDAANSRVLSSSTGGSIVVRKTISGLEVDITDEPVNIDEQWFDHSRVHVDETSLAIQRIDEAPDRLPRWTRERVDRIEVGRNVLAQLSESEDVRVTMMQALQSGAARGIAAATLRGWLISASGDDLFPLIGSQDPLIREAAFQYLRSADPSDPRHRLLWRRLLARGDTPRTFPAVRSYFIELWANRRPSATRAEQLLRLLQAPDPATRASAHYLLNAFYGPGPPLDLNASATVRSRSINVWRTIIQRVIDQR